MPSKTKQTKKRTEVKPHVADVPPMYPGVAEFEAMERRDAERRLKERELMMAAGHALLDMAKEQASTFRAQRIESLASAAKDLGSLGSYPAIDDVKQQILRELTVLGRELHESRIARASGEEVKPA